MGKYKYIYYKTDGTKEDIVADEPLGLKKMQELVGGYIDHMEMNDGTCLMINDEGLLDDLPVNPHIEQKETWVDISTYGLRGNVIRGKDGDEGEFVGVDLNYGS